MISLTKVQVDWHMLKVHSYVISVTAHQTLLMKVTDECSGTMSTITMHYYLSHLCFNLGTPTAFCKRLEELKNDFEKISDGTQHSLQDINVSDLVKTIMRIPPCHIEECDDIFLHKYTTLIEESKTTDSVFHHICRQWDYLNPDMYYYLVKKYSLSHLLKPLEDYMVKLDTFCEEITIQEFCDLDSPKGSPPPPDGFEKHTTKHDWNPKTTKLKKVIEFKRKYASSSALRHCAVWLANIEKGCVSITLLVPKGTIIAKTPEFFQTHNVIQMNLDGRCLYHWDEVCISYIHGNACL